MEKIDVFAADLYSEADWDLADLRGGPDLGTQARIRSHYACLGKMWLVVGESVPLSAVDLLSLAIRRVEAMSRESILKVRVSVLEST